MALRIKFATLFSLIPTLLLIVSKYFLQMISPEYNKGIMSSYLPRDIMMMMTFFIVLALINYFLIGPILKPLLNIINRVTTFSKKERIDEDDQNEIETLERGVVEISETINRQSKEINFINTALNQRNEDMGMLFNNTISALAKAIYARDPYTASHSANVKRYARALSQKSQLTEDEIYYIELGSLLHDVGKIGVPDHILTKTGKLTASEFEVIKKHPEYGVHIINEIEELKYRGVEEIILYHHERIDGSGYPMGLIGNDIPLSARIVSICDAFDAMTTSRSYKPALDIDVAISQLRKHSGTQFDKDLVELFIDCLEENPGLINVKTDDTIQISLLS